MVEQLQQKPQEKEKDAEIQRRSAEQRKRNIQQKEAKTQRVAQERNAEIQRSAEQRRINIQQKEAKTQRVAQERNVAMQQKVQFGMSHAPSPSLLLALVSTLCTAMGSLVHAVVMESLD